MPITSLYVEMVTVFFCNSENKSKWAKGHYFDLFAIVLIVIDLFHPYFQENIATITVLVFLMSFSFLLWQLFLFFYVGNVVLLLLLSSFLFTVAVVIAMFFDIMKIMYLKCENS